MAIASYALVLLKKPQRYDPFSSLMRAAAAGKRRPFAPHQPPGEGADAGDDRDRSKCWEEGNGAGLISV